MRLAAAVLCWTLGVMPSAGAADLTGRLGDSGFEPGANDATLLRRALSTNRGIGIEVQTERRALREQLRDAEREQDPPRVSLRPVRQDSLGDATFNIPYTRDIRGVGRRLGTAKRFIRLGRLLDQVSQSLEPGRTGPSAALIAEIDQLASVLNEMPSRDPSVEARLQQYSELQQAIESSDP